MKQRNTRGRFLLLAVVIGTFIAGQAGAVPTQMAVQGKLTDSSGSPFPPGPKTFVFSIHDAELGGSKVWPAVSLEYQTISTDPSGLWTANVGALVPLTDPVFADTVRWLEIAVDVGGPVILPRIRLNTGPYAYRVATVDGASGGTITSKVSIGPGHANTGAHAFIAGENNIAIGDYSTIGGGSNNVTSSSYDAVGGGIYNATSGEAATVGGGANNSALGLASAIGGGDQNQAFGSESTVGGGVRDTASGEQSTVSGGADNLASSTYSTVGGGGHNSASGLSAVVSGGYANAATATDASVGGGYADTASGYRSHVGGGTGNVASGQTSVVAGGELNRASGDCATVPGGCDNRATAFGSLACGQSARADHISSFVWSDGIPFGSTAPSQFLINASNGVGIGTNAPDARLHVMQGSAGDVTATVNTVAAFERSDHCYLSILSPGNKERGILFGEPGRVADGVIMYGAPTTPNGFQFRVNDNVTRMVLDSMGRLGVNTSSPKTRLHVRNGSAPSYTPGSDDIAIFESNGSAFLAMMTPNGGRSGIRFSTPDAGTGAGIDYNDPSHVGGLVFHQAGTIKMYMDFNGLGVNGDVNVAGGVDVGGNVCAANVSCPSDARLKEDIEDIHDALDAVRQMRGVRYRWTDAAREKKQLEDKPQIGLLAQDVQKVAPEAVIKGKDGYLSVDYTRIVAVLVEAIKEQQARIEALEAARPR